MLEVLCIVWMWDGMQLNVVVRGKVNEMVVIEVYIVGVDDFVVFDVLMVELLGRLCGLMCNWDYFDWLV